MLRHPGTLLVSLLVSLLLVLSVAPPVSAAQKQYTFAVVPNAPPLALHKKWTPFIERLSKDTGVKIKLKLYDSIDKFMEASESGEPDIVYSAPNMYYPAYEKQRYIALVRSSDNYRGRVFVRRDSPIRSLQDLLDKRVAFVGTKNLCSVFVRHQLSQGEEPVKVNKSYSGTTINVAKAVLMGQADAGATLDINFENDFPEMKPELKTIYETPEVASHPIAVHPRVSKKLRQAIEKNILSYDKDPAGKALLAQIGFNKPIKVNFKRDYSIFKEIDDSRL